MVTLAQLWLTVLLAAVAVFIASSLVHMVLKWHASDYQKLSNEDEVRATVRRGNPAPGQYIIPHCTDMKDLAKPELQAKYVEGPVATVTVLPNRVPNMGPTLGVWFVFNLVVAFFVAYLCSRTLDSSEPYLAVFRVSGTITFMAYAMGDIPSAIWMGKPWSVTMKNVGDALIYGLVTGGVFGSMWPR
jgi:hypothetical protein